jgi:hypothetical protein
MVFTDIWEISQHIFQYLGNEDLVALSTVSHAFQERAEHTLYYNINLKDLIDGKRVASWCLAILSESRRAHRVNTLKFPARLKYAPTSDTSLSAPKLHSTIKRTFRAMINLKTLKFPARLKNAQTSNASLSVPMLHSTIKRTFEAMINLKVLLVAGSARLNDEADAINSILPSTFNNCVFRLSGFAGELPGFPPEDIWKLLANHPDITYWVPGYPLLLSIPSFPLNILPNLREVVLVRPELAIGLKGCPIQSLVLVFAQPVHRDVGLKAITALRFFKETLRTLDYQYSPNILDWNLGDIVRAIAQSAPNLRTLTLSWFSVKVSMVSVRATQI